MGISAKTPHERLRAMTDFCAVISDTLDAMAREWLAEAQGLDERDQVGYPPFQFMLVKERLLSALAGEARTLDARFTPVDGSQALGSATNSSADVSPAQAEPVQQGASAYFDKGRCSGHAQFNGRYCRDMAGPERWCIHCAGFMLMTRLAQAAQEIATLKAELAHERELARNDPAEQAAARYAMEAHDLAGRLIEAEQVRAALRALVETWREQAKALRNESCNSGDQVVEHFRLASRLFQCADELDAVLRSPVERTRDEEKDLTRQSSASTAPDMGISAIPTKKGSEQ